MVSTSALRLIVPLAILQPIAGAALLKQPPT
jgi:hypothetical protein